MIKKNSTKYLKLGYIEHIVLKLYILKMGFSNGPVGP
jgi:hypothetical protein